MKAKVLQDAKVLVPNKVHQNFTESNDIISKGTIVIGNSKKIKGLRRGEAFSYRVFVLSNGQIIYSNKIKEMNNTEVTLGADGKTSSTLINFKPAEAFNRTKIIGAVIGLAGGFYYAKKNGKPTNTAIKFALVGGAIGYASAWIIDSRRKVEVTKTK